MVTKEFIKPITTLCLLIASTAIHANQGLFFNVSSNQSYLNITTTINHTYPFAGIKINTPGQLINPTNAGCTPNSNGYCVFRVSQTEPARIRMSAIPGPFTFTLCLNARSSSPLSCQKYSSEFIFLYAAMASGIIQETADTGVTWTSSAAPDGFPVSSVFLKNNILYAGTYGGNVAISNNYGASWNAVVAASDNPVFGLAVTPDNTVYAATNNGVTISTNGGLTWPTPVILTEINPSFGIFNASNGILYLASSDGFVDASYNHGATWIPLTKPNGSAVYGIVQNNNKLYAATDNGNIEISSNNGQSWIATSPPDPGYSAVYAIYVTEDGVIYAATANGNLVVSTNEGNNWETIMQAGSGDTVLGIFVG